MTDQAAAEEAARRYPPSPFVGDEWRNQEYEDKRSGFIAGAEWKGAQVKALVEAARDYAQANADENMVETDRAGYRVIAALHTLEREASRSLQEETSDG